MTTTTPGLDDLVTDYLAQITEARYLSTLGYNDAAALALAEAESIRDQINALAVSVHSGPIPCECGKVQIPVGVIQVRDDGVTHHGPDECGPCEVES